MTTHVSQLMIASQQEYDAIKFQIDYYISQGMSKLWVDDIYFKSVKIRLRQEGFKVKWDFFSWGYNISWKYYKTFTVF